MPEISQKQKRVAADPVSAEGGRKSRRKKFAYFNKMIL